MEAVKKYRFWAIFISILSIFAMSHNAFALETVIDLSNYDIAYYSRNPQYNCTYSDQTTSTGVSCSINSSKDLISISSVNSYNLKVGDIVETYAMAYSGNTFTTGETASGTLSGLLYPSNFVASSKGDVINFEPVILHTNGEILNYYNYWNIRSAGTGQYVEGYPEITQGYQHYSIYKVFVRIKNNYSSNGEAFTLLGSASQPLFKMLPTYNSANVAIYFPYFKVWRPTESKENKEVEQKTQEAVDESESAGGDSSTSAQTGTTGLLNAITGAVSVISSAQPTNCKINGNMGNLDIGQLDLCANPAPAFVQTIGSLILILMCVPLAISLFNRFIAIFRSFQS